MCRVRAAKFFDMQSNSMNVRGTGSEIEEATDKWTKMICQQRLCAYAPVELEKPGVHDRLIVVVVAVIEWKM